MNHLAAAAATTSWHHQLLVHYITRHSSPLSDSEVCKIDWIFDDKTTEFGLAQAQAVCVCVVSVRFDQRFSIRAIMRN
ncbi:hypothetical protein D917_09879 [Trichinella nativa]|uniref:Uncharacterized protein n=1 Tax=Trichinella nativa TaxID=6335 RepID=A0A1Y3EJE1_9BILA|nr:hypothetical protein D917_09879 [Trichinella nativa]